MDRYKTIINDWKSFKDSQEGEPVSTIRRNPLKAGEGFEERLRKDFPTVKQAEWNENAYRLEGVKSAGKSVLHWQGEYYVQEESAMVPVTVLDPQPGDKVIDMAAAPGGKTTQIAAMIGNNGKVIANDDDGRRLKSLHANIYRTGAACVAATNYDGRRVPETEEYDRVLLDAPCSGEGDRYYRTFEAASHGERENLSKLQRQLADKAARLLREDGTMVYSTCTFTPEENERVVKHIVENTGLELENIELELPHQRGVESFDDEEFGEEMSKTVRIYPNHFNSGGMYVAKFRK